MTSFKKILSLLLCAAMMMSLTACGKTENSEEPKETPNANVETLDADIIVVGSGLSGMSTTISALENGAKVILVEQMSELGRSFVTSFGNVMMSQVEENKEFHKTESNDTLDAVLTRWDKFTNVGGKEGIAYPDYDRVKDIVIESAETINWIESQGIEFQQSFGYEQRGVDIFKPVLTSDKMAGLQLVDTMIASLTDKGATVLTDTKATHLIVEDGVVKGIKAEGKDKEYQLNSKYVVLATGGFGGSDEMIAELIPEIVSIGYQFNGNTKNIGDGITLGREANAALYDDSWIVPAPGVLTPCKEITSVNPKFKQLNGISKLAGGNIAEKMLVNKNGSRITNEAGPGVKVVADMIDLQEAPYYFLFDNSSAEVNEILDSVVDENNIIVGSTIEELQEKANMPELKATFDAYQNDAEDAFGKAQDKKVAYTGDKYYLVHYVPDFVATLGGVKTNADNQVVDTNDKAIEGLYAVGEVTHRFLYNRSHFGNVSNSAALTMGRLTGRDLALSLNK